MSTAPSSAYQTSKAKAVLATGADTFTSYRDLLLAKFLQNTTPTTGDDWGDGYFNAADNAATRIAKIKDIFKIDGWARIEQGGGVEGFVGYCYSRTSGNGLYHNWDNNTSPFVARGSGVELPTTVNAHTELLNDAGLNVKGTLDISAIAGYLQGNGFKVTGWYRASFYNAASEYGVKWKKQSDSTYIFSSLGTLGVKTKVTLDEEIIDVDPTDTIFVEAPYYYDAVPYIINGEGNMVDTSQTVFVGGYARTFNYDADSVSDAYIGVDSRAVYMTRRTMVVGTSFLGDAAGASATPDNGVYLDMTADEWGQRTYFVLASGIVTDIERWNPTTSIQYHLPYMAIGSDISSAFNQADALNFTTDYVGRAAYSSANGGEWHFYDDVSNQYGVFLLEVIGDTPHTYENSTLYWIETNYLNLVIAFNVPNNDLAAYISSHGTVI